MGRARGGMQGAGMVGREGMLMNDAFAEMFAGVYQRGGPGVGGRKVPPLGPAEEVMVTSVEVTLDELNEGCTKIFGIPRVNRCTACDG